MSGPGLNGEGEAASHCRISALFLTKLLLIPISGLGFSLPGRCSHYWRSDTQVDRAAGRGQAQAALLSRTIDFCDSIFIFIFLEKNSDNYCEQREFEAAPGAV